MPHREYQQEARDDARAAHDDRAHEEHPLRQRQHGEHAEEDGYGKSERRSIERVKRA